MFKRVLRRFLFILLGFIGIVAIYIILAFMLPKIKVNTDFVETPDGIPIYLCSNGVHTDVSLPVKTAYIDWRAQFPPSTFKAVDSTFQYVAIGWGDKGFFLNTPTWADLTFPTAFKAAFALDGSAMHVTYDKFAPVIIPGVCQKIVISVKQYQQLIAYIQKTFTKNNGQIELIHASTYGNTDNFYEAQGHYSMLRTCNVWTCGALKSAGIKQGLWSPFQGGIMNGYQ